MSQYLRFLSFSCHADIVECMKASGFHCGELIQIMRDVDRAFKVLSKGTFILSVTVPGDL